jgi:hypothetical protein
MSPSHANKKGVRYRYYVSQAVLQNQKDHVGSVARVSAPDVEDLVVKAVKEKLAAGASCNEVIQRELLTNEIHDATGNGNLSDRELLLEQIDSIAVGKDRLIVTLRATKYGDGHQDEETLASDAHRRGKQNTKADTADDQAKDRLTIAFSPNHPLRKGIAPDHGGGPTTIDQKTREVLLLAIARSTHWMQQIISGGKSSFDDIASEVHLAERHIRRLAQLAFLSPKIIEAIENGSAPAGLTVTQLTQSIPYAWMQQEQMLGIN